MSDTAFPHTYFVNQSETEEIFAKRLQEYGGVIEWGMRAHSVVASEDGKGVLVIFRREDGTEEQVKCQYVVGGEGCLVKQGGVV
jgi:flavin-dependent dehydrogenase